MADEVPFEVRVRDTHGFQHELAVQYRRRVRANRTRFAGDCH
jgi:hypothetical protein